MQLDNNSSTEQSVLVTVRRFILYCNQVRFLSAHSLRAYQGDLTDFAEHMGAETDISLVGRDRIREYCEVLLTKNQLRATTVKRRMATVRTMFVWLERERIVAPSPFSGLDLAIRVPRRLPRTLEVFEMRLLLRRSNSEEQDAAVHGSLDNLLMHFIVVALFTTGLRVSELATAKLQDISSRNAALLVRGKGDRDRYVFFPGAEARGVLCRFLEARSRVVASTDRVLVTRTGKPITAQFIRRRLRALAGRAGINRQVTPHMLRHTAATQLLEADVDIRFVQRLLGHTSIATTQIYTQVRNATLKARLTRANTLARLGRIG